MEILKSILFGIVEGITEWLPVSSTGHMILLEEIVPLNVSEEFWSMFEVVIQFGAILAVVLLFWNQLWPWKKSKGRVVWKEGALSMWIKIVISCIPAGIVGVLFDDKIDELFYNPLCVLLALILVGVLFLVVETYFRQKHPKVRRISDITYMTAFYIGLFQLVAAIFPGTSRSGATIIGGLLLGLSRSIAAEYTFFLAVPVMLGASLLKIVKFAVTGVAITGLEVAILVVGTLTAFVVSLFVIRFLMGYIKKHDFKVFGWYRIILGILVILVLI